uniref:Uncharacterized protein n=1 Tax=Parascaris equorum TaxID=6256 RepID=A0A914RUL2_PAREQ
MYFVCSWKKSAGECLIVCVHRTFGRAPKQHSKFTVENAKIFVPSGTDLDYVRSRQDQMDSLTNSLQERWKKACLEEPPPDDRQKIVVALPQYVIIMALYSAPSENRVKLSESRSSWYSFNVISPSKHNCHEMGLFRELQL